MSLLLALAFATTGVSNVTQAGDINAPATASISINATASTTQGADGGNSVAQAFSQTASVNSTQAADTGSARGIPLAAPLDAGFTAVSGAQVETWTPVTETTGIIWNNGG